MDYGPAPEANGHVVAWLDQHTSRLRPLHRRRIHVQPKRAKTFEVTNPANGKLLAQRRARLRGRRRLPR